MSSEELLELEDSLTDALNDRMTEILSRLNMNGQLEEFLQLLGLESLLHADSGYRVCKAGKIIVIGQSEVKANILLGIAKNLGFSKDRFELYLEYDDAKNFNFRKMQWNEKYSVVLVGPMGHSGKEKGCYSSIIAALESESGYPPVVRLGSNSLKITKSDFKKKLEELKAQKFVA